MYSYLAFRHQRTYSLRGLASNVGMDRATVRNVLRRLTEVELVITKNKRWLAKPPSTTTASFFATKKESEGKWPTNLANWKYYLPTPECPLTMKQLAVYSILVSYGQFNSSSGLAKTLSISRNTVKTSIKFLEKAQLIEVNGNTFKVLPVPSACKHWFQETRLEDKTGHNIITIDTNLDKLMRDHNFRDGEIIACRKRIGKLSRETFIVNEEIEQLFEKSTRVHAKNGFQGTGASLFISMLENELTIRTKNERNAGMRT